MNTTLDRSNISSATNTFVYWIVALVAVIFLFAYLMRAGPTNDSVEIATPTPSQSFPTTRQ